MPMLSGVSWLEFSWSNPFILHPSYAALGCILGLYLCSGPPVLSPNASIGSAGLTKMLTSGPRDSSPPRSREGFQVAIICALEVERDAVLGLMHRYPNPGYGVARGDPNQYRYGELGGKPVVVALLIRTGPVEAAYSVTHVRYSFPNIRIAFVVGISAGVPFRYGDGKRASANEEDANTLASVAGIDPVKQPDLAAKLEWSNVKLGDVIISTQVTEYDFGRKFSDRIERKKDYDVALKQTPREITAFLRNIMDKFTIRDTLLPKTREDLSDNADLDVEFSRMPLGPDHIYAADHRHKHRDDTKACTKCEECTEWHHSPCDDALSASCEQLGCIPLITVVHKASDEAIHFGRVASGKNTLKSSWDRNAHVRDENFIAFEMEGLGAWEALPTIVVKSVVDYADSHKSKAWRAYPAARAALCASAMISLLQLPDLPSTGLLYNSLLN